MSTIHESSGKTILVYAEAMDIWLRGKLLCGLLIMVPSLHRVRNQIVRAQYYQMDANFCRRNRIVAAEQRAKDARERGEQLIQSTKAEAQKSMDESEERARKLVEDAELCSDTWTAQVERLVRTQPSQQLYECS
jgi:ribosomal protein L17